MYISGAELRAIASLLGDNPAFSGFWRKVAAMQGVSDHERDAAITALHSKRSPLAVRAGVPDDIALIQIAIAQGMDISAEEEDRLNAWMADSLRVVGVQPDRDYEGYDGYATVSLDDI